MRVAVLGAGTMGRGIAQITAMAEHTVRVHDVDPEALDTALAAVRETMETGVDLGKVDPDAVRSTLDRIDTTTDRDTALDGVEIVIEAIPEQMELKQEILSEVEADVGDDTLIGTNTSSLSVTTIMSALQDPERGIGTHFFNPPHLMELVEIVVGERTAPGTVSRTRTFVEGLGRTPVVVDDVPGFASSRLGVTLAVEAIRMVEAGVASPKDIDTAMELGYNHPMGPLKLTDVVGLDVRLDILDNLRAELGERFRPPPLLRRRVKAGKLGRKTGEGFYRWVDGEAVDISPDFRNRD